VHILEKAEDLPQEVIGAIQTFLQLMDNANQHNFIAHRNTLLMQLKKQLVEDIDFKEASPLLFRET